MVNNKLTTTFIYLKNPKANVLLPFVTKRSKLLQTYFCSNASPKQRLNDQKACLIGSGIVGSEAMFSGGQEAL